ncbi:MAG: hypothetical protein CVT67_10410 [Actinobacteria bacterium HGW-Actinobacteria-7]|jgi:hypothetical protein|nr:MAG: hypothetical protein CVT67_10410 [Actinobacteria bacterium HGW-Actinobacteria-7]
MDATEYDWEGFRALAGRLDALLVDELTIGDFDTFAETCRRTLAFLYAAGVSMPAAGDVFEDAGGAEFWEGKLGAETLLPDPSAVEEEIAALETRLRADIAQLQSDADEEDYDELLGVAARSLWDVRESLGDGMAHFDAKRMHEASWEWSFGFDEWGAHALAATTALHDLLWGAC